MRALAVSLCLFVTSTLAVGVVLHDTPRKTYAIDTNRQASTVDAEWQGNKVRTLRVER